MLPIQPPDPHSDVPLYRQLYETLRDSIASGILPDGYRLPATRELAGQFGLNRATISSAYELLEKDGLITGHVGRGSFVANRNPTKSGVNWNHVLGSFRPPSTPAAAPLANFANSRPSDLLFPLDDFRTSCDEVIQSGEVQGILQLGSPFGYPPLRRYLLDQARAEGAAHDSDDILITSGCQQAIHLLQTTLVSQGETVLLEDPVYSGIRKVFERAGARLIGGPVGPNGLEIEAVERVIERERPRVLAITPNFQNPTGATMPLSARQAVLRLARAHRVIVIENDIYGPLAYEGDAIPSVKQLDDRGDTVLLRSFSKIAFPGVRVGWVIAPRPLIERLTEAKQCSDLHSDQLSQAILLRFSQSGRLERHRQHMLTAGRERLRAALDACRDYLPPEVQFTRPRGGMSLWLRLPEPLDAGELLPRAEREGVTYLPGKYFAVSRPQPGSLRISFAEMSPDQIRSGIAALGRIFQNELERVQAYSPLAEAPAIV